MNTHADKTQENKSLSVANEVTQKQSFGESTFQFIDNRPEAIAQRKLQEMANNSPQVKQAAQLRAMADNHSAQQPPIQKKENKTGLPNNLKSGMENLSGMSLDDVKVHRNSDKPAQLQAHAYAQGTDIHLGPGQENHLPHEAWHVVQQKQGRVKPSMQMKGKVHINDDTHLEKEADLMGAKAASQFSSINITKPQTKDSSGKVVQRITIALGDLQEAQHNEKEMSKEEHDHAKIITDAEVARRKNSNEKQAHPWDERFRPFKSGPLADIGNEDIRIYGHGASYIGDNVVSKVGGRTPEEVMERLIKMGLPSSYSGEIYLTGCETAIGPKRGFLGKFYELTQKHCTGATVRGNLGVTTTGKDGEQGIWTGVYTHKEYDTIRAKLNEKTAFYLEKNKQLKVKLLEVIEKDKALKEEEVNLKAEAMDEFKGRKAKAKRVEQSTIEAIEEVAQYIKWIAGGVKEIDNIAYDKSGNLSVSLPAQENEEGEVRSAKLLAKYNEEQRLAKLEVAEDLAMMYGWAESTVTKMVYSGALDERAETRVDNRYEDTPSYIS